MSLEAATYAQDLDANNPVSTDRKSLGDDHLRLIKQVVKTTFPNADRAWRMPEVLTKTANYTVLVTDENKLILCDTGAGAFNLTLPTPTIDGWEVRVMKVTAGDVNPVYVLPPSGTINGLVKLRLNVPFVEHRFIWSGSSFVRPNLGERAGSLLEFPGLGAPVGYAFPTGQSLLRADYPELFAEWSTGWGAVDGTHFNAPDLRDKFLTQPGSLYSSGDTGGENTHTLLTAELPTGIGGLGASVNDTRAFQTNEAIPHQGGALALPGAGGVLAASIAKVGIEVASGTISGSVTGNLGSGTAHENRPPFTAVYRIFRLC